MIFLHSPKAGGSTAREFLLSQAYEWINRDSDKAKYSSQNVKHVGTHSKFSWNEASQRIDDLIANLSNGTVSILENHVCPNIQSQLVPHHLKDWRAKSKANDVPMFVFGQISISF